MRRFLIIGLAALALASGCDRSTKAPPTAAAPQEQTYVLTGTVTEVNRDNSSVEVRHDAIAGLMPEMRMRFAIKDAASLAEVRVGDTIEGKLWVRRDGGEIEDYELKDLIVTDYAPEAPKSLTLDTATGEVTDGLKPIAIGAPVPDFAFVDHEGRERKLSDERGRAVALTFIYTRCPLPNFCPLMDAKFAATAKLLATTPARAEGVRLIGLTLDPAYDTPAVLAQHAAMRGAKAPLWTLGNAGHDELAKLVRALGLQYGPVPGGEIAHNLCTAVIAPDGTLAKLYVGNQNNEWTPADLLAAIVAARNEENPE